MILFVLGWIDTLWYVKNGIYYTERKSSRRNIPDTLRLPYVSTIVADALASNIHKAINNHQTDTKMTIAPWAISRKAHINLQPLNKLRGRECDNPLIYSLLVRSSYCHNDNVLCEMPVPLFRSQIVQFCVLASWCSFKILHDVWHTTPCTAMNNIDTARFRGISTAILNNVIGSPNQNQNFWQPEMRASFTTLCLLIISHHEVVGHLRHGNYHFFTRYCIKMQRIRWWVLK